MKTLNWGIISTGGIARKFAAALSEAQWGALYAIGSRSQASADAFGEQFNVPHRYSSYEALLADPAVDVVYNALPNHLHLEWTIRAAQAGKHVLCEKPLTVNAAEAAQMLAAIDVAGVFLMEAFMYRCHPQTTRLIELIHDGAVGEVRLIQASFGYDLGESDAAYSNIRLRREACGGGIMDVGCYTVSMARLLAGAALGLEAPAEPERLGGAAHIGERSGVDEWATAALHFPNGILGDLACAAHLRLASTVQVWGSEGNILVPSPWYPAQGRLVLSRPGQEVMEIDVPARAGCYALEADAVAQALPGLQASYPCMTWADSLGNMKALDAWRAAVGLTFDAD